MVTIIITIDKITTYPTDKQKKNQFLKQKFACEQDALIILADTSETMKTSISSDVHYKNSSSTVREDI